MGNSIDSSGNVYSFKDKQIVVYDSEGYPKKSIGKEGSGDGEFLSPQDIEIDSSGKIYVLDAGRYDVQVFDKDGNFLLSFGSEGEADGQLYDPQDIAIDSSGNVYVADWEANSSTGYGRVQKFSSSGILQQKFEYSDAVGEELENPTVVSISNNGFLYIYDSSIHHILVYSSEGSFSSLIPLNPATINSVDEIDFLSNGMMVILDRDKNSFHFLDSSGSYLSSVGTNGSGDGQFDNANDLVIDSNDNIFILDKLNHRIQVFNNSGIHQASYFSYSSQNGYLLNPIGITLNENNIVIADSFNDRIQTFDSDGNYISQLGSTGTADGEFQQVYDMVFDDLGKLYVADGENRRFQIFDAIGIHELTKKDLGSADTQFNFPVAIALDSSGNIYIADSINDRVK